MFNLIEELKNYVPYNDDEKRNVQETLKFLNNSDNCYDRSNHKGHITGGAFVVDREGNILLNHHKIIDMWFQFGGHCDGETDCMSVAERELMEESGIEDCEIYKNTIFDVDWHVIPSNPKRNEPEHYHYDIAFMFITNDKNYNVTKESLDIKWFNIKDAYKITEPTDKGAIRKIKKYENIFLQKNINNII